MIVAVAGQSTVRWVGSGRAARSDGTAHATFGLVGSGRLGDKYRALLRLAGALGQCPRVHILERENPVGTLRDVEGIHKPLLAGMPFRFAEPNSNRADDAVVPFASIVCVIDNN